jgi:multicomponent Na+:H+ antiporter subunit B
VIWQLDLLLFVILVVLAVLALWVRNLLAAVPILSAFSLVVAVMFAGMAAVDVAFVEAVLGAGLTGILFIILIRTTGDRADVPTRRRDQILVLPLLAVFVGLMVYASGGLPDRGDPDAPAHQRVSPDYLVRSVPETRTPNVVTAILADYRSQDTLGEVVVIFTAGTAMVLILAGRRSEDDEAGGGDAAGEGGAATDADGPR